MVVYGDEPSGDILTFQFYDYESDTVYDISETIEFELNLALGNVVNPLEFNIYLGLDINAPLTDGWNWMSLNVYTADMSLNALLSSLDDNALYIKNQTSFSDYYADFGWYGTLDTLNNVSMYKLNMLDEDNIALYGMPVDVSETILNLNEGWN